MLLDGIGGTTDAVDSGGGIGAAGTGGPAVGSTVASPLGPHSITSSSSLHVQQTLNTYSYWTYVAHRYVHSVEQQANEGKSGKSKKVETSLIRLREELATHKKSLLRLNDRMITLEKKVVLNQSYLEQIKNLLSQRVGSKSGLLDRKKKNYIHILSRESPYMSSNIFRVFVYEKLVPWECSYDLYDVIIFLIYHTVHTT